MCKLDFDSVLRNIVIALTDIRSRDLEPSRLYMNSNTYMALHSIFHTRVVTMIPEGTRRTPTIYGVRIAISDDLPDEHIEVSIKTV